MSFPIPHLKSVPSQFRGHMKLRHASLNTMLRGLYPTSQSDFEKKIKNQIIFHLNKYIKIMLARECVHKEEKGCVLNSSSPSGSAPL